ncbi:hypothetical protein [Microbacterium sp. Root180]|uniref:hypothetical protein n=1 Tax=Microbacterium sp. Root180 TaxID=1736483 RepID=UPI0007012819|nr:hypothetical protein [Microbacterium sp. Root180]KRB38825.1 hypothetical protein ASD93_02475 [Microbacterium sp. Root180]
MIEDEYQPWTRLRGRALPCAACGVAVSAIYPERVEVLEVPLRAVKVGFENGFRHVSDSLDAQVTRCDQCWRIRESAVDMLRANPDVKRAIGSPEIALYRLELALSALDALGVTDHRVIDEHTKTGRAIMRLIDKYAAAGGGAWWSSHARRAGGQRVFDTPASSSRWSHLGTAEHVALHRVRVEEFRERTERPKPVALTDYDGRPSGCMLCGVGTVDVLPSLASHAWTAMEADAQAIGGRPTPEPIEGAVCPRCDKAIDAAGGVGQSAMRASILDYLGANFGPRWETAAPDFGVVGWAVLRGVQPNATAWDHVDLSPLSEEIAPFATARRSA